MNTITIKRNNDRTYNTTVKNKDTGAPIDITDYTLVFSVKRNRDDADDAAIIHFVNTTHTVPAEGTTYITIDASETEDVETGKYYYDILLIGSNQKRSSSLTGLFIVEQEITDGI